MSAEIAKMRASALGLHPKLDGDLERASILGRASRSRASKIRYSLSGKLRHSFSGSISGEILEDRELAGQLQRTKLAQGASERQSLCVQGAEHWAKHFGSDLYNGLTAARAEELLQEHGPNILQKAEAKSIFSIFLEQINVLNILVICGGILCCVQGTFTINGYPFGEEPDYFNGSILFIIVGVCVVVGAYMEWSCSRVMADVSHMSALHCTVIRDGSEAVIDAENVVPGDIVLLRLGDAIPADCIVAECAELLTSEMALTGEPEDVVKTLVPKDLTSPFPSNLLYASTGIVNGTGRGLVLRTGMKTEIGKVAALLGEQDVGMTSVQRTMNSIGFFITVIVALLTAGIFFISYRMKVNDPSDPCPTDDDLCFLQKSIMRGLFAAVGAIPESLGPACTFLLVMGCKQLQSLNASTVKLAAVDTIGACSFVCSDKTGTLTEGMMTCMHLSLRVRNESTDEASPMGCCSFYPTRGFDPRGGIFRRDALTKDAMHRLDEIYPSTPSALSLDTKPGDTAELPDDLGDPQNSSAEGRLVRSSMMAWFLNSYGTTLVENDGVYSIQGNMSEGALVVAAAKARLSGTEPHTQYERIPKVELPFSSSRKMMATVHKLPLDARFEAIQFDPACQYVAVVKGAPEVLLPRLSKVLVAKEGGNFAVSERELDAKDKTWFEEENESMSGEALRVLCVALRPLTAQDFELMLEAESNADERSEVLLQGPLLLLGVAGLMDPPRASARSAIAQCHTSGIRVAMVTGDQTPTAIAVAKSLGILSPSSSEKDIAHSVSECSALKRLVGRDTDIDELCERVVVWSRAQPTDKVTIVESLQRQRHIVAMTGDGVNDAGALKKADIGLAMGIAGTDVTKNAADIILLDDRFATIVDAVAEGRRIFGNIQRLSAYMLCCNVFDVIVMMAVMALGWAVPLEQSQLFKANFITHMFYPWCMVFEPATFYNMMHPPRSRDKPLLPALTRKVVIPLIFIAYFCCMLLAQYAGSIVYVGTVDRNEQTGTSSLNSFYADETNYACLYANTMRLDKHITDVAKLKSDGNPDIIEYVRDAAPLHCRIRRLTLSGWKVTQEWGRHDKPDPEEAIHTDRFNWFTGSWDGMFDLENSFLKASFEGETHNFLDKNWADKKTWLQKCSDTPLQGRGGESVVGDSDRLCWRDCGGEPCWQKDSKKKAELKKSTRKGGSQRGKKDEEDEPIHKPVLYKKFNAGAWGCRQMRSLVLLAMVLIEFVMLYSFSTHEFSLPLVGRNISFPLAWVPMLGMLLSYIYLPVYAIDQGFAPLDGLGVAIALSLVVAYYIAFELTKVLHRSMFDDDLQDKTLIASLLSEGRLHAFPTREEAWLRCAKRRPMTAHDYGVDYGSVGHAASKSSISSGSSCNEV